MDWIHAGWTGMTVVSLMLAFVYLSIWIRQRRLGVYLTFALCSMSAAAIAIFELFMMRASTPELWAQLVRWLHVPLAALFISLVLFVRLQFRASRRSWTAPLIAVAVAVLAANFLTGVNLDFREVSALESIRVWNSAPISVPVGEPNPWIILGTINALLMIAFLIDTVVIVRRRGVVEERQSVFLVCVSIIAFLVAAGTWELVVSAGLIVAPLLVAPSFLGISLVMAYLIGSEILRASEMATSLVTAEARLLETAEQMDLAASVSGQGFWSWDTTGAEPWLSPTARFLLGIAPDEAFEWSRYLERVAPDDRARLDSAIEQAIRGDGNIHVEFRIASADKDVRWLVALGKILFTQDHVPAHSYGVVVDTTERRTVDERFRLLVESMPWAVLLVNEQGVITFGNRQAESMFGYTREQLIGTDVETLMPQRYRNVHAEMRRLFAEGVDVGKMDAGAELVAQRRGGGAIMVEIGLTPIQIGQEQFTIVSIADIGERKRMEREAALQRDELAHLSRVASLSALSSSLAHELNQPLTAILSNAQAGARFLARQPPDADEVAISFTNIVDNAKRAGDVIRKLRSMLRNDRTEFVRLDIDDVVREVLQILRSDLIDRRVEVALELAADLPPVKGDRVQLQQVLLNLMMNASDAMGSVAHPRVLTVRTLVAEDGEVEVQIADNGSGIPEQDLARIFAPFVSGKKGGMGLGLSVCSMLVQAHAGMLWATNNSTGGATLHFRLPRFPETKVPELG
ncbi:MAG TPA: PAS domain S-box protein [Rudaea sp.]|nr:PAS domain S-box protein [Rudaea sp.]